MTRLVRILFAVILASAMGLTLLSMSAHAAPWTKSTAEAKTQTGGGEGQIPKNPGDLTKTQNTNLDFNSLIEDYSAIVREEAKAGKLPEAIGREIEIAQTLRGTVEKSGTVVLHGEDFSGKSLVAKHAILRDPHLRVFRLKLDKLFEMDSKAEQSGALKKVILGLEKMAKDSLNPNTKTVLYIDNMAQLNQGADVEIKPANTIIEAIGARRGVPMWLETDGKTNREKFTGNEEIMGRISQVETKNSKFDAVVYHLRRLKADIQKTYGVIIQDSTLAETARLSVRFYSNNPFQSAESLLKNAANRTVQELRGNTTEAMRVNSELAQLEAQKASIMSDIDNDPGLKFEEKPGQYQKDLMDVESKIAAQKNKLSQFTAPDPTLSAEIALSEQKVADLRDQLSDLNGRSNKNASVKAEIGELNDQIAKQTESLKNMLQTQKEINESGHKPSQVVSVRQVQIIASEFLKVPLSVMSINIEEALKSISLISNTVIGQNHIVEQAAISIAANRAERRRAEELARKRGEEYFAKPIWSAMLAGSTGTGKTEIAKQLAKQLGIPQSDILRFDMNEYAGEHTVARLLGAPPGYVGYDAGGALTNGVAEREYRVILFDEIEKAHPKIFDALMSMLDEGHITDGKGRKVRFGNTIIMMTTNLGQEFTTMNRSQLFLLAKATPKIDVTLEDLQKMNETELRSALFKAKARATWGDAQAIRVDDMLMTNNHTAEAIHTIARNLFKAVAADFEEFDKVKLFISDAALEQVEKSYKVTGGARIVKQFFKNNITNQLNVMVGSLPEGSAITVDFQNGQMDFIVTSQQDHEKAMAEAGPLTKERRQQLREEIRSKPSEVGRANQEIKTTGLRDTMFDPKFQVRESALIALRRYRK